MKTRGDYVEGSWSFQVAEKLEQKCCKSMGTGPRLAALYHCNKLEIYFGKLLSFSTGVRICYCNVSGLTPPMFIIPQFCMSVVLMVPGRISWGQSQRTSKARFMYTAPYPSLCEVWSESSSHVCDVNISVSSHVLSQLGLAYIQSTVFPMVSKWLLPETLLKSIQAFSLRVFCHNPLTSRLKKSSTLKDLSKWNMTSWVIQLLTLF